MPREKMVQCKNEDIYNKKIPRGKKKIITIQKTYKKNHTRLIHSLGSLTESLIFWLSVRDTRTKQVTEWF